MGALLGGWKRSTELLGAAEDRFLNQEICVMGWVKRRRNLGAMIFVDLRDRSGILQLIFDEQMSDDLREKAQELRQEYVIAAKGILRERSNPNEDLPTGRVELQVQELKILSRAETPPFVLDDAEQVGDALRLKYRFLDLRRPYYQNILRLRSEFYMETLNFFREHGFSHLETPMLGKSTPEGARDYLVPSRVFQGHFFALPQSPQLYKQILMISGFDRYVQIARCFRDEDLRADRQPEFTQIDVEMSFVDVEDVLAVGEGFCAHMFKHFWNRPWHERSTDLSKPLPRLTYEEAMRRFGSDKPDLRFGMELQDVTDVVRDMSFPVFSDCVASGGQVGALVVEGGASMTRKEIDALAEVVKTYKAKGLAWLVPSETPRSSFNKFLQEGDAQKLRQALSAHENDLLLFVADQKKIVQVALGQLRLALADQLNLIHEDQVSALWVTDFPLFEYSEEEERFVAQHHPFTAVNDEDLEKLESDPGNCLSKAYDLVINGQEMGGGSIRIHDREYQKRVLRCLGFSEASAEENFGFLLRAFDFGVPPHGGIAFGFDRWVMLFGGTDNIRDVIAFPKVQSSACLMTEAPGEVSEKQLQELALEISGDQVDKQ